MKVFNSIIHKQIQLTHTLPNFQGNIEDFSAEINHLIHKQEEKVTPKDQAIFLKVLKSALNEIISADRFLGKGVHSSVYEIDKNYALKVDHSSFLLKFIKPEDIFTEKNTLASIKSYFGQTLVNIGNKIQIIPNAGKHIPVGLPVWEMAGKTVEQWEGYYKDTYLPTFAKISQSAYNKLAKDYNKLNEIKANNGMFYALDNINPNNIILINGKNFGFVDKIDAISCSYPPNTIEALLKMFLYRLARRLKAPDPEDRLFEYREILRKLLIASQKAGVPFEKTKTNADYIWSYVLEKAKLNSQNFNYSLPKLIKQLSKNN